VYKDCITNPLVDCTAGGSVLRRVFCFQLIEVYKVSIGVICFFLGSASAACVVWYKTTNT
jgi:hypothetical protein